MTIEEIKNGTVYGDMLVTGFNGNKARPRFEVKCQVCGYERTVNAHTFKDGTGWQHKCCADTIKRLATGAERDALDRMLYIYQRMCRRVLPDDPQHADYYDRGIRNEFKDWMHFYTTMRPTYQPGLELDRRDNNGNYSPTNCRWVTKKTNCRNRRSNRPIQSIHLETGEVKNFDTVVEFIEHYNLAGETKNPGRRAYAVIDTKYTYKGFQLRSR